MNRRKLILKHKRCWLSLVLKVVMMISLRRTTIWGIEFDRYMYVFRSENRQNVTGLEASFTKLQEIMRLRYKELEKLMV